VTMCVQRGRKIVFTQAAIVQKNNAKFDQELKMVCTLYKDPSTGLYQPKETRFVLRQRLGKSKRKVGEADLDLARYASMEEPAPHTLKPMVLGLSGGEGGSPKLLLTIRSHWVKDVDADEDGSEGSDVSDMSRVSIDTSMSNLSAATYASSATSGICGSNSTPGAPELSDHVSRGLHSASPGKPPLPTKARSPSPSPASTVTPPSSAAIEDAEAGSNAARTGEMNRSAEREAAQLRNENRRLTAELKAAQLSLAAARKERDSTRDELRRSREQSKAISPLPARAISTVATPAAEKEEPDRHADPFSLDGRSKVDGMASDDLRSILMAREAELITMKIRWADAETEKDVQGMKVKKTKKMLYKVGVERDQLARKVADLEVKLVELRRK